MTASTAKKSATINRRIIASIQPGGGNTVRFFVAWLYGNRNIDRQTRNPNLQKCMVASYGTITITNWRGAIALLWP